MEATTPSPESVDPKDNEALLLQDCSRPLFRWFLSRIDNRRILKEVTRDADHQADRTPSGLS